MAASTGRNRCVICGKEKATLRCGGCLQEYCFNHLANHRQELNKQLDEVELTRDLFRQTLTEKTHDPQQHALIQQIDEWERNSIQLIRQTAEEARQTLFKHTNEYMKKIEVDLNQLTDRVKHSREENDFYETDLRNWNEELMRLSKELSRSSNIKLQQDASSSLINKISVDITSMSLGSAHINASPKWMQNGITVAGGKNAGNGHNQLHTPSGLYVDSEQTVYVADFSNHRIVEWKNGATRGQVIAGGNGPGNRTDQLNSPSDVLVDKESDCLIIADRGNQRVVRWPRRNGTNGEIIISNIGCWGISMDNDGYLYVCDYNKHEVRRWKRGDRNGVLVAGGNGAGTRLDQLHGPTGIFVDQDHSVYVSDNSNHCVMKWVKDANEGVVVAGSQALGNGLTQLSYPRGLAVDQLGTVYIADHKNHRVMRWSKGATQGTIFVGGNEQGGQPNQLSGPMGLSFDRQGNLYVADYGNHRVQKFNIDRDSNT